MKEDLKLKVNLNEYLPLRDVVFNTLREAIIVGDLMPGERLMETQLASILGVSRTPIREAIRKLELENLVVMIPRKGAEVASFTIKDIEDVLVVRASLESLAVRIACEKITEEELVKLSAIKGKFIAAANVRDTTALINADVEFHECILESTKNDRLVQILNHLSEQIYRFRVKYINKLKDYSLLVDEHERIYSSIANGEVDQAEETTVTHIERQQHAMVELVKSKENS